jgi:hypothetical protein
VPLLHGVGPVVPALVGDLGDEPLVEGDHPGPDHRHAGHRRRVVGRPDGEPALQQLAQAAEVGQRAGHPFG